ncbi:unnamed protein product [Amoebophrya sp. A25]|nr:unnamed protein product [Amoebophrya sp. A25]|eukprot:GSA25T00020176001.1
MQDELTAHRTGDRKTLADILFESQKKRLPVRRRGRSSTAFGRCDFESAWKTFGGKGNIDQQESQHGALHYAARRANYTQVLRVLDVGCGHGRDVLAFNRVPYIHCDGADPCAPLAKKAQGRLDRALIYHPLYGADFEGDRVGRLRAVQRPRVLIADGAALAGVRIDDSALGEDDNSCSKSKNFYGEDHNESKELSLITSPRERIRESAKGIFSRVFARPACEDEDDQDRAREMFDSDGWPIALGARFHLDIVGAMATVVDLRDEGEEITIEYICAERHKRFKRCFRRDEVLASSNYGGGSSMLENEIGARSTKRRKKEVEQASQEQEESYKAAAATLPRNSYHVVFALCSLFHVPKEHLPRVLRGLVLRFLVGVSEKRCDAEFAGDLRRTMVSTDDWGVPEEQAGERMSSYHLKVGYEVPTVEPPEEAPTFDELGEYAYNVDLQVPAGFGMFENGPKQVIRHGQTRQNQREFDMRVIDTEKAWRGMRRRGYMLVTFPAQSRDGWTRDGRWCSGMSVKEFKRMVESIDLSDEIVDGEGGQDATDLPRSGPEEEEDEDIYVFRRPPAKAHEGGDDGDEEQKRRRRVLKVVRVEKNFKIYNGTWNLYILRIERQK